MWDPTVFQTGVQNLSKSQGGERLCLGARAGLMHFCLQVGSELSEWDLWAGVELAVGGGSPSSSAAPVSWVQCLHPRARHHREEAVKVPQRQVQPSQCPGRLWPFPCGTGHSSWTKHASALQNQEPPSAAVGRSPFLKGKVI